MRRALAAPAAQIAENGGVNGAIVVNRITESKKDSFGYNALTREYTNLVAAGIVDPTKVVRIALQNAASIATLLLTTDALVIEEPEKPQHPAADDMGEDY